MGRVLPPWLMGHVARVYVGSVAPVVAVVAADRAQAALAQCPQPLLLPPSSSMSLSSLSGFWTQGCFNE